MIYNSIKEWRRNETYNFKILSSFRKIDIKVGVSPDILVKENENEFEFNSSNDNQLNYALQLLQS